VHSKKVLSFEEIGFDIIFFGKKGELEELKNYISA